MNISRIDLTNPNSVDFDDNGRSIAYFCKDTIVSLDHLVIEALKKTLLAKKESTGKNVRICLHNNPDALFHQMIVLEQKGKYYRPHKHINKEESYHIIEGAMAEFVFDDSGRVIDLLVLQTNKTFLYRVGANIWHASMPLTNIVIYHECKIGPFIRETDSIFPSWAPSGEDLSEVQAYLESLKKYLPKEVVN